MGNAVPLDDLPGDVAKALPFNSRALDDHAAKLEQQYGLPTGLLRSIKNDGERSNTNQVSPKGARGVMQFMPDTAKEYGLSDPTDPIQALDAAARYLVKAQGVTGSKDPAVLAAAYNGGMNRGILKTGGIPDIPETKAYAARVQTGVGKYAAPASKLVPDDDLPDAPKQEAQPAPSNGYQVGRGAPEEKPGLITSAAAGLGSGVGKVAMGAQHYIGKALDAVGADQAGQWLVDDAAQGRAKLAGEVAPYKAANPITTGAGELGGEIIATLPVGGMLGGAVKAAGATRLGTAIGSSGMATGAKVAPGLAPATADVALRMVGGAVTGGATAGMIDPSSAGTGAAIGAALPAGLKVAGMGANAVAATVRPFFAKGQDRIAGNTLREFAASPKDALTQLLKSGETISGSMPTTAMAAGDDGLAALSRAMQNADPRFASELAARQTAQNQARTAALESMAGNTGKLDIAKTARDTLTSPMREGVLDSAGKVPSDGVLSSIDSLIAMPDNAGKLAQQALNEFRGRIAQFSKDGAIDSRALYAIRKDINEVLGGKLQGEAGNLRYAAGQLTGVKGIIDDAIDLASRRVAGQPAGSALMPHGSNMSVNTILKAPSGPRASWADYLQAYTRESIPINQMEKLDKIMRSVQTGSVDSQGGLIVSGAKLNNILKNEGDELTRLLDPKQMDLLRRVSADLNASQIANSTGRAVGSNTLQNLAQNQLLTGALGRTIGGSTPATAMLGRLLQLPYGTASKQIQERLGNALLDPKEAARLLADPKNSALVQALQSSHGATGILPNVARTVSAGLASSSGQSAEVPAPINVQAPANPTAPEEMPAQQDPAAFTAEAEHGMPPLDVQPEADELGTGAMPAQEDASPTVSSSMRPDGTLAISGDPQALRATLIAAGIPARSIVRNAAGVMVGRSQAGRVQEAIARMGQPGPQDGAAGGAPAEMVAKNQQMPAAPAGQIDPGQAGPQMASMDPAAPATGMEPDHDQMALSGPSIDGVQPMEDADSALAYAQPDIHRATDDVMALGQSQQAAPELTSGLPAESMRDDAFAQVPEGFNATKNVAIGGMESPPTAGLPAPATAGQPIDSNRTAFASGYGAPEGATPQDATLQAAAGGEMPEAAQAEPAAEPVHPMVARIQRLKDAGEDQVAKMLQRKHDHEQTLGAVQTELAGMRASAPDLPHHQNAYFQTAYQQQRTAGAKPAEAAARAGILAAVQETAPGAGMPEKAVAALQAKLDKMPVDDAPGFVQRFTQSLIAKGVMPAFQGADQIEQMLVRARDGSMHAALESVYADQPQAAAQHGASVSQDDQTDPAPVAAEAPVVPRAPEFASQLQRDGTLVIKGDAASIRAMLTAAGIPARSVAGMNGGVLVGRSQVAQVRSAIENMAASQVSRTLT